MKEQLRLKESYLTPRAPYLTNFSLVTRVTGKSADPEKMPVIHRMASYQYSQHML